MAVAGNVMPDTATSNVTDLVVGSTVIAAKPLPCGAPGGTSSGPVMGATKHTGPPGVPAVTPTIVVVKVVTIVEALVAAIVVVVPTILL